MTTKADFFTPERAGKAKEHLSPSGQYKLVITPFETREGCWNYTQGIVFDHDGKQIAEVQRNYSSFPFLWVEAHPNGHPYLVCGEDYQGQTVIELDTGKRKDFLPDFAKQGFGFCWAVYQFDANQQLLIVDGCIWAGPYEYRFYDFSNPMEGWPKLECDKEVISEDKWPEIEGDIIKCFRTENTDEVTAFFRREGQKLVEIKEVRGDRVFSKWLLDLVREIEEEAEDNDLEAFSYWDNDGEPEVLVRKGKSVKTKLRIFLGEEDDGSHYGFALIYIQGEGGDSFDIDPSVSGVKKAVHAYLTKLEEGAA